MERYGCALRRLGRWGRTGPTATAVALCLATIASAGTATTPPALSGPLLSSDGTRVSVSGLVAKVAAQYVVLRESGSGGYVVIPWVPKEPLRVGQPVDASGVLATQSNGLKRLEQARLSAWLDASGAVIVVPAPSPRIKGGADAFGARQALSAAGTASGKGQMSLLTEENPAPPGSGPGDPIFCDTLQIAVDQANNALVKLHSRPILSVGSGSFVLGENADSSVSPTQSLTTSYSGSVSASDRAMSVAGVLQKPEGGSVSISVNPASGFAHVFTAAPGSVAYAKSLPDDAQVTLGTSEVGKIVTAVLGSGVFYVKEDDRACGIRVEKASHGRQAGQRAYVVGVLKTNANHERYIQATQASQAGSGECAPLRMTNASLGGGHYFRNTGPPAVGQEGVAGGAGLNTVGLLARTMGKITDIDTATPPTWFRIADGSVEGGVKVDLVPVAGTTIPLVGVEGQFVTVTGVCSLGTVGSSVVPVLRPVPFDPMVGDLSFDPPAGDYCGCQNVQITGPDPKPDVDVSVWYTIDDSDPAPANTNAREYDPGGSVVVRISEWSFTTLKAAAIAGGWTSAEIESAEYTRQCMKYYRRITSPPAVSGFRVWNIYQPSAIELKWTPVPTVEGQPEIEVQRASGEDWTTVQTFTGDSGQDTYAFTSGNEYRYRARVKALHASPPQGWTEWDGSSPGLVLDLADWNIGAWSQEIAVTPVRVLASDNGFATTRRDPRAEEADGEKPLLNLPTPNVTYRGGLSVGTAPSADGSGTARSLLKFPVGQSSGRLWAGSLNVFYTRPFDNTPQALPVTVAYDITEDDWDQQTLTWSGAPGVLSPPSRDTVSLGPTDCTNCIQPHNWCTWESACLRILDEMQGDGVLSARLSSTTEATPGRWAYLAKKEYGPNQALAPQLLYALGAPLGALAVTVSPPIVRGGCAATGTVYLNGPAPQGGQQVSLCGTECLASVPSAITIAAGQTSGVFPVWTVINKDTTALTAQIAADANGLRAVADLTIEGVSP